MDLLEQPALVEDLEVAADGHVRDAELAHEIGDADRAVLADAVEDEGLALAREHQRTHLATTEPSVDAQLATSPSDSTDCRPTDRKSTYSHKHRT